jgi:DNA polymerase
LQKRLNLIAVGRRRLKRFLMGGARKAKGTNEGAEAYLPSKLTLPTLKEAAAICHGCPLYKDATQTVFGEGKVRAPLMFVGEQPGDEEDRKGRPFVGPAGRLLNRALEEAGIERGAAYVTNVVKHFKWVPKGTRRLHKKPGAREIGACIPWLEAEIELLQPRVLVLLGSTAAQAVFGADFRVTQSRGEVRSSRFAEQTMATVHPSSLLRLPSDADEEAEMAHFVDDLRIAADLLKAK